LAAGLVFGTAVGLRGWTLAAAAPALTFGLVATGGFVLGKLGVRWELGTFAGWALAVSVVAFVVVQLLFRRKSEPETTSRTLGEHLLVAAGVVLGMAAGAVTFLRGITSLDRVSQEWTRRITAT